MLAGKLPFPQTEIMALIGALIGKNPEPLPNYVPTQLTQIVGKALEKNPSNRFHSAIEMRLVLQDIINKGLASRSTLPLPIEQQPTARLDTAQQTKPDEVAPTLVDTTKKSPGISKQFTRKTAEQIPALATQEQPPATQEITIAIPATQKVLPQQQEVITTTNNKTKINKAYQLLVVAIMLIVLGVGAGWLVGLFPSSQKAPLDSNVKTSESAKVLPLEDKNKEETSSEIPTNNTSEITLENEKLLKEITDKTALLEKQIVKVPASEKASLEDALKEMKESLQAKSLEDTKPEELKAFYKNYLFQLNILTTGANALVGNVSQPKGRISVNNEKTPVPVASPIHQTTDTKALQAKSNDSLNSESSEEEVKEMRRQIQAIKQRLKEDREMRREKQSEMSPQELREKMKENRDLKREKKEQLREFIRQRHPN
jgi:hypothetical protein